MYGTYLLALFVFLGVDGKRSIGRDSSSDDIVVFPGTFEGNESYPEFTVGLAFDSKQLNKLEIVLNDVIIKHFGPLPVKLSLRASEDGKSGLIQTVQTIGDAICNGMRSLFEKLGLASSNRRRPSHKLVKPDNSLKVAVYYQLLRFPLEFVPVVQSAKTQLNRHMERHNYASMGYKSVKYELRTNGANSTEEWKFLTVFGNIGMYGSSFYSCLEEKKPGSFDIKVAVGNLTDFPPEVTGKILRSRLGKRIPRLPGIKKAEYNQLHAFVCHAAVNDSRLEYRDCLVEIKRVDRCLQMRLNGSSTSRKPFAKFSGDFVRAITALDDSCGGVDKDTNNTSACNLKRKAARSNGFPYILDFFMGDLKKSPTLERMAREVSSAVNKIKIVHDSMNEIATLVEMYKRGLEKKEKLLKLARDDPSQVHRYNRMSNHFTRYKRFCFDIASRTARHIHGAMSGVEKVFFDPSLGIAKINLTENTRALRCWSGFMDVIFGNWFNVSKPLPTTTPTTYRIGRTQGYMNPAKQRLLPGVIKVPNEVGFVKRSHEEALKKLMESMKRLGQAGVTHRPSALVNLANTFLLATMFYESIALLAAAIYRQDSGTVSPSNSAENEESDRWPPRDRRSPPYPDDQEDLQTREREDEEGSLSVTKGTGETTANTLGRNSEGIDDSVGNSTGDEATVDIVESTTVSNRLFI